MTGAHWMSFLSNEAERKEDVVVDLKIRNKWGKSMIKTYNLVSKQSHYKLELREKTGRDATS